MKLSDDVIEDESTSTFNSRLLDLGLSSLERLNRRFKLQKRRQLFIRTHNETLSVVAMCISNPYYSLLAGHCQTQPQLQPDALSLSAIISQYFINAESSRQRI